MSAIKKTTFICSVCILRFVPAFLHPRWPHTISRISWEPHIPMLWEQIANRHTANKFVTFGPFFSSTGICLVTFGHHWSWSPPGLLWWVPHESIFGLEFFFLHENVGLESFQSPPCQLLHSPLKWNDESSQGSMPIKRLTMSSWEQTTRTNSSKWKRSAISSISLMDKQHFNAMKTQQSSKLPQP